jgi:hypothetical protein
MRLSLSFYLAGIIGPTETEIMIKPANAAR